MCLTSFLGIDTIAGGRSSERNLMDDYLQNATLINPDAPAFPSQRIALGDMLSINPEREASCSLICKSIFTKPLIFELMLNPEFSKGKKGCFAVADLWKEIGSMNKTDALVQLEEFFYTRTRIICTPFRC
jgi:hypothetical protein